MTARERLRDDLGRYYLQLSNPTSRWLRFRKVLRSPPIWAIGTYRFGQYLEQEASQLARIVFRIPYVVAQRLIELLVGINLPAKAQIGPGLYIAHYGGIWINPGVVMGEKCTLSTQVMLGAAGSTNRGAPVLGDRVWVGPKATVNGPLRIGSGAVISPNSLVVTNVPENAVVIGVPAKILSYSGSDKLIEMPPRQPANGNV